MRGVGAVLRTGEGAHVDGLGDLEPVVVFAVDDVRGFRHPIRPHQAVAGGGVVERVIALGARAGHRVDVAGQPTGTTPDRKGGDEPGDEQTAQRGQQQRAPGGGSLESSQPLDPR
jgi:hypothetical protein